jgi:hypothetical protein
LDTGGQPWVRSFGQRISCHCLLVLALIVKSIAAMAAPVDR